MTITQIIENAARDYVKKSTAPDKETPDWIERDFKAGVEFATSDPSVLKELLQPLAEFLLDKCWRVEKGIYQIDGQEGQFTTEELLIKYIQETIKPKEDAGR